MEPVCDFTKGLGFGFEAYSAAGKNKELIQGKNYFLAAGPQVVQILSFILIGEFAMMVVANRRYLLIFRNLKNKFLH